MAKKLTTEEIDNLYNKMVDNGMSEEADLFIKDPSSFDFRLLEENPNFTDKFKNVAEFTGDKYSALQSLYEAQDGKLPSKSRIESFTEKFPNISEQEIVDWFNKTNKYRDEYNAERVAEGEKIERTKEIKNLNPILAALTSDYSKQRYIDDPTTSVLGGFKFNPLSSEGHREARDVALGLIGGGADFVPGWGGIVAGPIVRGVRDALHTNEKYKPEGNIISNVLWDLGSNVSVDFLPTAVLRKISKGSKSAGKITNMINDALRSSELSQEKEAIRSGVETLENAYVNNMNPVELYNLTHNIPDSEFKSKILADVSKGTNVRKAIEDAVGDFSAGLETKSVAKKRLSINKDDMPKFYTEFERREALRPELNKLQKALVVGDKGVKKYGPGLVKISFNPEVKIERDKKEFNDSVDRIINNYSMLWSKNKTPQGYDTPLIKAAYDKWKKEND